MHLVNLHTRLSRPLASHGGRRPGLVPSTNAGWKRRSRVLHAEPSAPGGNPGSGGGAGSKGPGFNLADPAGTVVYGGRLPSGRRMLLGGLGALGVALGGNLGGVTSALLALDGGALAARLHLDVIIPVRGFKRCLDLENEYEFVYPAAWLADQTLAQRAAQRAEAARGLDPPPLRKARQRRSNVVEPSAAFGPPGSSGEENVSVIVAPIYEGFTLSSLGSPGDAAQRFLDTVAAPAGGTKRARLVAASDRRDASGQLYYSFEFVIQAPTFERHNISVLTSRDNLLFTMTVQCPQSRWERDAGELQAVQASFNLLPRSSGFPAAL